MGEDSWRQTGGAVSQTHCEGQKEENESGSQSEVVRQIEGLLGGEESREKIISGDFWFR